MPVVNRFVSFVSFRSLRLGLMPGVLLLRSSHPSFWREESTGGSYDRTTRQEIMEQMCEVDTESQASVIFTTRMKNYYFFVFAITFLDPAVFF